jgi:hypothetical protein
LNDETHNPLDNTSNNESQTEEKKLKSILESSRKTKTNTFNNSNSPKGISKKFKIFPSNKEREYLNYYNFVDNSIKDKEIKYIRFIGKKLLTNEQTNKIINDRIREYENNLIIKRKIDINRHNFELDTQKCSVDRNMRYLIAPTFDFNQNDNFFKSRHYINLFLKNMSKIVIKRRADLRMNKINEMLTNNNIKSTYDYGEYVEKEWLNQFNKDSNTGEGMNLKFIQPQSLNRSEVYLSYDYNLDSLKQTVNHQNNINLDELREFENFERSEVEVVGYKG